MGRRLARSPLARWAIRRFLGVFPPGIEATLEALDEFFNRERYPFEVNGEPRRLFDDGDAQVRDGFVQTYAAAQETDPVARQQLAFAANVNFVVHEQAAVQPYLDGVIGSNIPGGTRFATWLMYNQVGDYGYDPSDPLPVATDEQADGNLLISTDLIGSPLDPTTVDTAGLVPGMTFNDIAGWDAAGFPVDPQTWYEAEGAGGPIDGTSDTGYVAGARVDYDWSNYDDRMWHITNVFQQTHTNSTVATDQPSLVDGTTHHDDDFPDVRLPEDLTG